MPSIRITEEQKNLIVEKFSQYALDCPSEYIIFYAKNEDFDIKIYSNSKGTKLTCLINSSKIVEFCRDFDISESQIKEEKEKVELPEYFVCTDDQIGSDEVGFGDFFGPLVVAAAYVDINTMEIINEYGIGDSKKINDKVILDFIPKIISKVHYSLLCVDNEKLTEYFEKGMNFNEIKSLLHNRVLNNVYKKFPHVKNVFIDQFTAEKNYYKYIEGKENNIANICFKTKGESYFPSVALASCIARFHFLMKMKEIGEKYDVEIPFGASKKVDDFAKAFIDKYGLNELSKIVKTNFRNYKNLIEN